MAIEIREPTQKEIDYAKKVIEWGYYQTSRKYRHVARLPKGMTGKEALKSVTPENRHYWVDGLGESSAGDHYLCVHGKPEDSLTLTIPEFNAFRKLGGNTYRAKHWEEDEERVIKVPLCEVLTPGRLGPSRTYRVEAHDNCEHCKAIFEIWQVKGKKSYEERMDDRSARVNHPPR